MTIDPGSLLIGLGVFITTITAILFKIKYVRKKCSSCLVTEKSFDRDLESAANIVNEAATAVPKAYWGNVGNIIKRTLTPKEIKLAETILETIEEIGEKEKAKNIENIENKEQEK